VNPLAVHYSRFRVADRILLTGHSHQAWPDVAFEAQQRAWLDAAEFVDDKWVKAEAQAALVRAGFGRLLADDPANIALGQNTHELVTRWLSALPLRQRPRLVTTDGEFHSIRRQVDRLDEDGALAVVWVAANPAETLSERLARAVDDRTACVMVSSVLYETAEIVPNLGDLASVCASRGAALLVDAYHHLNVIPFDLVSMGLAGAFVTGGGYKYCQLGEGNCFLRVPPDQDLRPVVTGWFAEFAALEASHASRGVRYGPGASAFGGATYDPTSHYRAAAVFDLHARQGLTPERLRQVNQRQVMLLKSSFDALHIDGKLAHVVPIPDARRGGFLALRSPRAGDLSRTLRERGVLTDARGDMLRLGPAPYVDDQQLRDGMAALGEILKAPRHVGGA
jgi:selenocysteine lyase/cysteine desulfurase